MEVPRLGVKLELQPQPQPCQTQAASVTYTRAHRDTWPFNTLSEARYRTDILIDISWVLNPLSHSGNSKSAGLILQMQSSLLSSWKFNFDSGHFSQGQGNCDIWKESYVSKQFGFQDRLKEFICKDSSSPEGDKPGFSSFPVNNRDSHLGQRRYIWKPSPYLLGLGNREWSQWELAGSAHRLSGGGCALSGSWIWRKVSGLWPGSAFPAETQRCCFVSVWWPDMVLTCSGYFRHTCWRRDSWWDAA